MKYIENQLTIALIFPILLLKGPDNCKHNFGQGSIIIGEYILNSYDSGNIPLNMLPVKSLVRTYTYFIKGDKILRDDNPHNNPDVKTIDTTAAKNGLTIIVNHRFTVQPVKYLIDWNKEWAYMYSNRSKQGTDKITALELKKDSLELFYRMLLDSNKTNARLLNYTKEYSPIIICNHSCSVAVSMDANGDSSVLYYSSDSLKVQSPLNGFAPTGFAFNVLGVKTGIHWTKSDGKSAESTVIFKVEDLDEGHLNDSLFLLPFKKP
jgi:hypothetical protein